MYLKGVGYLRFKAQNKLVLTQKRKSDRWFCVNKHLIFNLEDLIRVILTDKVTFEKILDSFICYFTYWNEIMIFKAYSQDWTDNFRHFENY